MVRIQELELVERRLELVVHTRELELVAHRLGLVVRNRELGLVAHRLELGLELRTLELEPHKLVPVALHILLPYRRYIAAERLRQSTCIKPNFTNKKCQLVNMIEFQYTDCKSAGMYRVPMSSIVVS